MPENRQSYVDRTITAARRLSNSQIFLIFLVPGIITLIEHFVYDGTSTLWESALFALAAVCIALGLGGVNMLLSRRAAGRATHTLKQAPYPEHRWSLVAVSVGPSATSDGQAENGGRSPSPERAAIHNLLVPEGPRKVVLIHSPDTRAAAERLRATEHLSDCADLVQIDPVGDIKAATDQITDAVRRGAASLGLTGDPRKSVIIDLTAGLVGMTLASYLASQTLRCPTHARVTPSRRDENGKPIFDTERAQSIVLNYDA